MLAKAVAHHTTAAFIRVVGSEFVQKYLGEVCLASASFAHCFPYSASCAQALKPEHAAFERLLFEDDQAEALCPAHTSGCRIPKLPHL